MKPPPRPPRRRADTSGYRSKVRAAEIPLPPPARLQPDGANRPVFLCATVQRLGQHPATVAPGPPRSTQPCDDPLSRLGCVRRIRGAAWVATVRPVVRCLRYGGMRRADSRDKLVHECRHDRQPRHLNSVHAIQPACRHVAMFLQLGVDPNSSLAKARPSPAKRQPANPSTDGLAGVPTLSLRTVRPGSPASPARSARACSSRTARSARRAH